VAAAGLFLGLVILWLRVGWLQVVQHSYYSGRAELNQEQRVLVRPVRGELLDRRGRPLARDLLTCSVSAAPREMADPVAVARGLATLLHLDARRLEEDFRTHPRFVWVARHQPPETGENVADRKWRGVHLSVETQREYALGEAASELDSEKVKRGYAALARMEAGRYGYCERCHEEIDFARLKAIPHANLCMPCQKLVEL